MNDFVVNRRATFDYEILDTLEAGIELYGYEVKAVKSGHASLAGAFAIIRQEEAWLINATITLLQPKNAPKSYDPIRTRRLLLHKSQIKELIGTASTKGLTIVPLKMYNKKGRIKLLLGIARHKKSKDKRETIKKREAEREMRRNLLQ